MIKKIDQMDDVTLVSFYVEGNKEAERELVNRYEKHSTKLAGFLLDDFKDNTRAEMEDLVSIGLYCLFVAIGVYNYSSPLFPLWKRIARNAMMEEIKRNTTFFATAKGGVKKLYFNQFEEGIGLSSRENENEEDVYRLLQEIVDLPELGIKKEEKDVFFLNLEGYTVMEISKMLNLSYTTIRNRILRVRKKIQDILFNS